jgi:putative membrane-bound dehydrogenase-like protein
MGIVHMTRCIPVALVCFGVAPAWAQTDLPFAPVPSREAAARMTVPDGFKVTLFAGEPDVVQPIAFTFDDRGRLWVVECMSYPKWNKEIAVEKTADGRVIDKRKGKDRVLIFEDTDGDGQFDKRTVFADGLTNLSGIEYGFGGIWLCSIPNLIYIPFEKGGRFLFDKDGKKKPDPFFEDKPAGPPEIKLDGWSLDSGHNAFNGLKWGPDGWLYGCNGILATSHVGVPGTPDKERTPINCGVWRYHPTKKKFDVVAHGTTNPWGLDWDEYGELFITNCVIDHVWHVVPGGHYERMYGNDFNPHLYKLMPSIADHKHWAGGSWTESRGGTGAHSDAGGGHAHVGCMIYLSNGFPDRFRNSLFTCNLHGSRVNNDFLERKGSTYVAKHGKDFLFANDPWFRGIAIDYGPDGAVYVSDWCDTGECHNYQVAHTTTGRIYKIAFRDRGNARGDLAKYSDDDLIDLQNDTSEWHVRHARRILQERAFAGVLSRKAIDRMVKDQDRGIYIGGTPTLVPLALRHLWTHNVVGLLKTDQLASIISRYSFPDAIRVWAIRLALEERRDHLPVVKTVDLSPTDEAILLAAKESQAGGLGSRASPRVRLHIAAGLQRMPPDLARIVALALLKHAEDETDPYLPLMIWYGVERLPPLDLRGSLHLFNFAKIPLVRENLARRITLLPSKDNGLESLIALLDEIANAAAQRDILRGIQEALKGRRQFPMPRGWQTTHAKLTQSSADDVRERAQALAILFGDKRALEALRLLVADSKATVDGRRTALQTLVTNQPPELVPMLQELLDDQAMRTSALQALAAYADPKTPSLILQRYTKFTPDEKADAVHTLASRPSYALALLDAVADKTVARSDLTAFTVRQLLALNDKQVTKRVNEVWGTLRPASQEKAALMAKYKKLLTGDTLRQADLANGRLVYQKNCASCHKLFGEGGNIGPELTGSQRANLDYVLENMLDPSAVVPREYQVSIITTASGRTLTGIVKEETERAVTVQTQNEIVIVPKDEIDVRRQSNLSMMPEGMLDRLTNDEVRDLVAYLASK